MYCAHLLNIACSDGVGAHHVLDCCDNNLNKPGLSFLILAICNACTC
jgi:hypothetical protein